MMTVKMGKDTSPPVWYLYIIRCHDASLYTGITTDVPRRFQQHQKGTGAKYLKSRNPLKLVFKHEVGNQGQALSIENKVKKFPKNKKLRIIREKKYFKQILEKHQQTVKT